MKTKKMTLSGRALSAALALVLAFGLVPSQALTTNAYAAESDGSSSDAAPVIHSEDVALDQAESVDSSANQNAAAEAASSSDANAADAAATDAKDATEATAANNAAGSTQDGADPAAQENAAASLPSSKGTASAPEADDMLNIQVNVAGGEDASAAIAFGGLVYTVNNDGENTVSLTGWTGTAPTGALNIPQTIRSGQTDYSVTRITVAGGGIRSMPLLTT